MYVHADELGGAKNPKKMNRVEHAFIHFLTQTSTSFLHANQALCGAVNAKSLIRLIPTKVNSFFSSCSAVRISVARTR